jgi:hypothetical protein
MRTALLGSLLLPAACTPAAAPPAATEVAAAPVTGLPAGPDDPAWERARIFDAPLLPQDMVEPRQLERSTELVHVRALSDGRRVAFRLDWRDPTRDDEQRPGVFSDACALQLPARVEVDVPAPQMGEAGKEVEIVFWRATWQAALDGGSPTIAALYPGASIDHYPFEAPATRNEAQAALRYVPARAVENDVALPRTSAVEMLVASGPGTLRPAAAGDATGAGKRTSGGWSVVLERALPPGFERQGHTQVAFAVWQGSDEEIGARKMRTLWIPFTLEAQP